MSEREAPERIDPKTRIPKPGDVLEWRGYPDFPEVFRRWRVEGVHYGALRQESIVEMVSLSERPGDVPHVSPFPMPLLYVPAELLNGLTVIGEDGHD